MQTDRYPKLSTTHRLHARNQFGRYGRHEAVACDACGREATTRVRIRKSWFAGEDDVLKLCGVHTDMARAADWATLYRDIKERGQ